MGALLEAEEAKNFREVQNLAHLPILTPSLAKRQTLKIALGNGLEAYLIHDEEAAHAGASLTVQAGSWNDPDKHPGLAHFVEHMLFLGTEKYPVESQFDRFIRTHDGQTNAYTASDYTLYLFSIAPPAFEEAIDRFSSFFKMPLFNPSGVERELNAIDQEFAKNFNKDSIRENYVRKALANLKHPYRRFQSGNSNTLAKATPKVLKDWYQEHYSANHMRLIIYGPQPLEVLKNWAVNYFKDIPSSGKTPSYPLIPALSEESQGKIVTMEPHNNIRALRLTWELPFSHPDISHCRPDALIASILGHEGNGSLLSLLKKEGLADAASCESRRLGKRHLLFSLTIGLSEMGLQNRFTVIDRCFQAILALKNKEINSYLFEELRKIQTLRYQYQSRENTFEFLMSMGGLLAYYGDLASFPEGALIPQPPDQKTITEFLNCLSPERAHLMLLARQPSQTFDRTEQWMEIPYRIDAPAPQQIHAWNALTPHPDFHIPLQNPFIPQELKLFHQAKMGKDAQNSALPTPKLIADDGHAKIYYAPDSFFHIPEAHWFFEVKTPSVSIDDPLKTALADLYVKCLDEALQPYSYPAKQAGLSYEISRTDNGILFSLSGYHEKAGAFFETLLPHIKNCRPSESAFSISKDALLRGYRNFKLESPLQQGYETIRAILYESHCTRQERADKLEAATYESFISFIGSLYEKTFIEGLLYGNIEETEAVHVCNVLQKALSGQPFAPGERLVQRIVVLPEATGPYAIEKSVQSSANAAILGIEDAPFSFKKRAAQQILMKAMGSAFYATLRTKQQTGYLLHSHAEEHNKHLFSFFSVQSATHDPRDLLSRFELFIESFLQEMESKELNPDHFEKIRQSQLSTLENTPQNLEEAARLLKTLAFKYGGDFDWMAKRKQGLMDLTYSEFLELARQSLGKQNRRRLGVLVRGTSDQDFHYHSLTDERAMRNLSHYTKE